MRQTSVFELLLIDVAVEESGHCKETLLVRFQDCESRK
jgi:hypothetical protein